MPLQLNCVLARDTCVRACVRTHVCHTRKYCSLHISWQNSRQVLKIGACMQQVPMMALRSQHPWEMMTFAISHDFSGFPPGVDLYFQIKCSYYVHSPIYILGETAKYCCKGALAPDRAVCSHVRAYVRVSRWNGSGSDFWTSNRPSFLSTTV